MAKRLHKTGRKTFETFTVRCEFVFFFFFFSRNKYQCLPDECKNHKKTMKVKRELFAISKRTSIIPSKLHVPPPNLEFPNSINLILLCFVYVVLWFLSPRLCSNPSRVIHLPKWGGDILAPLFGISKQNYRHSFVLRLRFLYTSSD